MTTENEKKKTGQKQSFEEALQELEKIVEEMDSGELDLDKMVAHFEKGSKLIKTCTAKLNEVEQKIEKLVKKDGEIVTEPLGEKEE